LNNWLLKVIKMSDTIEPAGSGCASREGIACERLDDVLVVRLNRPARRNALNDTLVRNIGELFRRLPKDVRAVVLSANGPHFCAGLDLAELREHEVVEGMYHSRMWHEVMNEVQFAHAPVIAALHGGVIGGGLELACSAQLRVADTTAFFALPEGQRGLFVGGGGSVRIPRLIGVARMTDMMLTGRVYDASEGHAAGITQYLVPEGQALTKALELARAVAGNSPVTNYAVMHVLPRIAEMTPDSGLLMEAMIAGISQSVPQTKERLTAFLEGRAGKVKPAKS
jgi:(methylthio)acryloyl-CoA hydratase